MALMTLQQAKDQLRITHEDADEDLYLKVEQASAMVLGFVTDQGSPVWTEVDVPKPVQLVAMLALTYIHEHRGDEMKDDEAFWESLKRMLMAFGYTDPTLA